MTPQMITPTPTAFQKHYFLPELEGIFSPEEIEEATGRTHAEQIEELIEAHSPKATSTMKEGKP